MDRLAGFIRAADVDIALLQEVDRDRPRSRFVDMSGSLAAATGMEAAYGLNVRLGPNRGVSGLTTLSRFPIVDQANTYLPSRGGTKQRGVLRTDIDVRGTVVSVFNTHLEPGRPQVRLGQIAATMRTLAGSQHPLILGGDLNATPGSSTLRVARSGLRDAWVDAGRGPAETAPAGSPRIRIDYLLYAPPLRVTRTEVLPGLVSDHRAVRSRFVLSVAGEEVCLPQLDGPIESGGG
jgi:endonuclease/exonuclease/phosphatase family metal-dependent hydrolase